MSYSASPLRDYQVSMKRRIFEAWERHRSVMVQMPTGTGKTHLLASVVREWLSASEGRGVWIVAHRRELVSQVESTLARFGLPESGGRVRALSIQWLSRHWGEVPGCPGLVVVDEAHHALAESYRELWSRFPGAYKLGMTATPCRLSRRGFTDLFEVLVVSEGVGAFIRSGWLSPFDYVSVRPDSASQRLVDSLAKRGADGDFQVKEMEAVLNRRPGISRLYGSVCRYAPGKKGIVYAVSIAHARHIADYYSRHGLEAAAIDSRTPAALRRRLVEDFRRGRLRVLVNVDVFSEGFDCPDVEFVQLARPTLSLAKYLQQVGRGLRRVPGKESCTLIDNVGLYRLFGLPTAEHDWQAMFEGRMAGKGVVRPAASPAYACAVRREREEEQDGELEVVVSHENLLAGLDSGADPQESLARPEPLKPFKDRASGRFGLKRGEVVTAWPQFADVLATSGGFATVRFENHRVGLVDETGGLKMDFSSRHRLKLLKEDLLAVSDAAGGCFYVDLRNGRTYAEKPGVLKFGGVELLAVGHRYCSRTRKVYETRSGLGRFNFVWRDFYLKIYDYALPVADFQHVNGEGGAFMGCGSVCLLEGDSEEAYRFCGVLADGSIVVADGAGKYYHVEPGRPKRYVACAHPSSAEEDFAHVIPGLKADAEARAARKAEAGRREDVRRRQERLGALKEAVPFKSGSKWGLKVDQCVVVPPLYHRILPPVGGYCVFEGNPCQWGVMALDGRVVVEPRYWSVELKAGDVACLTVVPGKTETVRLGILENRLEFSHGDMEGTSPHVKSSVFSRPVSRTNLVGTRRGKGRLPEKRM